MEEETEDMLKKERKAVGFKPLVYDLFNLSLVEATPEEYDKAVYFKSEADKVIAHQKMKRCEAMANYSLCYRALYLANDDPRRAKRYLKWYRKWLELAEKFKEMAK